MIKQYTFWFKCAIYLQILTGCFHILGHFNKRVPKNKEEEQLFHLMENYLFDFGAGFHHSMQDIMDSFSLTFVLLLFFSGAINLLLLKSDLPVKTIKRVLILNVATYFLVFIIMSVLTFLPPIICIGLILLSLTFGFLKLKTN